MKRVKRETAPTSASAQFILAWRSEDSVEKRGKQPKRGIDSSANPEAAQSRQQKAQTGAVLEDTLIKYA